MRFDQVKNEVLMALYQRIRESDAQIYFQPTEIRPDFKSEVGAAFIDRACYSLSEEGMCERNDYDGDSHYGLTDEGITAAEELLGYIPQSLPDDAAIPASDRVVGLNHNSAAYLEVASGLEEVVTSVKSWKTNELSAEEKASLESEVEAARSLWNAYFLTVTQIRVGIIMAVERVQTLMGKVFELTKGPLLVEAIKAIVTEAIKSKLS